MKWVTTSWTYSIPDTVFAEGGVVHAGLAAGAGVHPVQETLFLFTILRYGIGQWSWGNE